ncbi:MAG: hypothetical protein ACR2QQ_04345 [Gammaproteobacteria bacterium]
MSAGTIALTRTILLLASVSVAVSAYGQSARLDYDASAELGRQFDTAEALYEALKEEADAGRPLEWDNLPPWGGIYTRGRGRLYFDPDRPADALTTAKLTPEYQARFEETLRLREQGIEYDPLSYCHPPGYPRWITEPNLREFVVTPDQTWFMNELANDIRRVYTDGREHTPEEDRYPLYNGDSIGFWDGHRLIVHTNQLMEGIYQRAHPNHSDQIETVEIWQQVDDRNIEVDLWVYDPPSLMEPWYTRQTYTKLTDPDKRLRIRYWNCSENQNNSTFITEEGATQFTDFTFTTEDNE